MVRTEARVLSIPILFKIYRIFVEQNIDDKEYMTHKLVEEYKIWRLEVKKQNLYHNRIYTYQVDRQSNVGQCTSIWG